MLTFIPSRRTQPYRQPEERPQTPQLAAMLGGKPLLGPNPMDQQRQMRRLAALILGR